MGSQVTGGLEIQKETCETTHITHVASHHTTSHLTSLTSHLTDTHHTSRTLHITSHIMHITSHNTQSTHHISHHFISHITTQLTSHLTTSVIDIQLQVRWIVRVEHVRSLCKNFVDSWITWRLYNAKNANQQNHNASYRWNPKRGITNTLTMSSCAFHLCHDQTGLHRVSLPNKTMRGHELRFVALHFIHTPARRGAPTKMISMWQLRPCHS